MPSQNVELSDWEQQAITALTAQLQDPQQAIEDARIEDEANCTIGAGIPDHQLARALSNPAGFYQERRLKTLVYKGLRELLTECNLGVGLSAAQTTGKQLLNERLQQPAAEIQQQLIAILSEDLSTNQAVPLSEAAQSSLRQVIQTVLSAADWDTIAAAAAQSLQQNLRAVVSLPQTA